MFYYYGSKTLLAKYYPEPKSKEIIEPFAGSGAYSIYHLLKDKSIKSTLIEKDKRVVETWKNVLSMNVSDIQNYPTPKIGEQTSDFLIMTCSVSNAVSKCKSMKYTERLAKVFNIQKNRLVKYIKIKDRIEIIHGDFSECENRDATWFIDPPYQITNNVNKGTVFANGDGYGIGLGASDIDFQMLSKWAKSRKGQVIVCEKIGANWLPFRVLKDGKTSMGKNYKEMIWTNE